METGATEVTDPGDETALHSGISFPTAINPNYPMS